MLSESRRVRVANVETQAREHRNSAVIGVRVDAVSGSGGGGGAADHPRDEPQGLLFQQMRGGL